MRAEAAAAATKGRCKMNLMDQTARQQYLADGYRVARGLLDRATLESINREIGELFAIQLRRLNLPVDTGNSREAFRDNALRLLKADVSTYISTARLTQNLPSVDRLLL